MKKILFIFGFFYSISGFSQPDTLFRFTTNTGDRGDMSISAMRSGTTAVTSIATANGFNGSVNSNVATIGTSFTGIAYSTGTGLQAAIASNFPTLNQNTTGNAATATLASTVTTNANLTGEVTSVGNATTIANNAVTTAKIADANVTGAKLATGAVDLASNKVTGVVPIANGGTGSATQNFVDLSTAQSSIGGAKTFTAALTSSGGFTSSGQTAISSGFSMKFIRVTTTGTDALTQNIVKCNPSSAITRTLPPNPVPDGFIIQYQRENSTNFDTSIVPNTSQSFELGYTTRKLLSKGVTLTLVWDLANSRWFEINF